MCIEDLKREYLPKYMFGQNKFYNSILTSAINKLVAIEKEKYKGISPDLEYLSYCDQFLILYRREGDNAYLEIAKLFRKAGHRIYRIMLKKKLTERNKKFLNLVK